ncbi:hypothetical protein N656DRAFT_789178 [Canariomyces notabilis]|uniref:F-box domain-containing protein n=1 Tax=Canariomyces notabilis TaxID=2074819 RepID=A0AAN6TER7_9PEZI|nr:hypothetical protein N656DRAFT_789178 [Canariomyces arenarius]
MLLTPDRLEKYGSHTLSIVDYTLDDAHLETRCPLDNGRHNGQPKHSVGRLDLLPYELISQVLLALDLPSRTAFRRVNRRAMGLVDSLHEYQMVLKHCPNILRAIISINAKHFDLATLYRTLCTTKCAACNGSFGSYLYLITCKRVCYSCFTEKSAYLPVSAMLDIRNTSLSRDDLKSLPHIFSLPGYYTKSKNLARGRTMLVDLQSMNKRASEIRGTKVFIRVSTQCATTDENRRHMAIISAPYFSSSGRSAHWGFYCAKCNEDKEESMLDRSKYTEKEFANHMAEYGIDPHEDPYKDPHEDPDEVEW